MDEKTAQLRDIFMNVADGAEITERQEESRGSLTDEDDEDVDEKVRSVVDRMREQLAFETELDTTELVRVVRGFYDAEADSAIADALGVDRGVVVTARLDLHLLRERETKPAFDIDRFRRHLTEEPTTAELAAEFDIAESTARKYRRIVETQREIRRVNDRYADEFEELLTDAALEESLTRDVKQDGLGEATEGMENDLSF